MLLNIDYRNGHAVARQASGNARSGKNRTLVAPRKGRKSQGINQQTEGINFISRKSALAARPLAGAVAFYVT